MSGSGGFLLKFLSKLGGQKGREIAQRYAQHSQFLRTRNEAFDRLVKESASAIQSNDPEKIRSLLEAGRIAAELHQKESRIYMSNLQAKLETLEINKKNKKTPYI